MSLMTRRIIAALVAVALSISLGLTFAQPASAANSYPVLAEANIRSGPTTKAPVVTVSVKGTKLSIDCFVRGELINGTDIWNRVPAQGWISDSMLLTGSDAPVVPPCPGTSYNRQAAVQWALSNVNDAERFKTDCTWFVSNALWAGGIAQTTRWQANSMNPFDWAAKRDPGPTKAAAQADFFKNAMTESGTGRLIEISIGDRTAGGVQLGDIIMYDWDNGPDGKIDHVAIVTAISADGTVGISQHTPARPYRQWNANSDGSPLTNLRVYALRILL